MSAQQYLRKASIVIGAGTDLYDLSGMHFVFDIKATTVETPKTAQIRIYNLSKPTSRRVTEEGASVIIGAGYSGSFNTIFSGQIVQARIGRENGTDTYLDITAADGDVQFNFSTASFSMIGGSDALGRVGQIAKWMGIQFGENQLPMNAPKLHRGVAYFGMARDYLRTECASMGCNWSISDGKLDIISEGGYKGNDVPVITAATGLIGVPEQTDIGISFRVLLNPNLQKDTRVKIDNALIRQYGFSTNVYAQVLNNSVPPIDADGVYILLYVNHVGDTRGTEWYSDCVAYSKIRPGNTGQLQYMPDANAPKIY